MKVAFLTETGYTGKWPVDFPNARTEVAWQIALNADHFPITHNKQVSGYDHVFIIFPKGQVNLNAVGAKIANTPNPFSDLLASSPYWMDNLKEQNGGVYFVQEGPHWMYTELEVADQIYFYNMLDKMDAIFVHNNEDQKYYTGLVPNKIVTTIPTLMIEDLIKDVEWKPEDKAIIGGNFARWYGGFESFIIAQEFNIPVWGQTSHAMREHEGQFVHHLPRVQWVDWIKQLSTFKYAVHLMPTVAAGTFSLNCSYLGIPCIGNKMVDTQIVCQPDLAVDVHDLNTARHLAKRLVEDKDFYEHCSVTAKRNYQEYYTLTVWKEKMKRILDVLK